MENSLAVHQKCKHKVIIWLSNSTPRYIYSRKENTRLHKMLYVNVQGSLEMKQCADTTERINWTRYVRMVEYYPPWKDTQATSWMDLEHMRGKSSQAQKITHSVTPLIWNVLNRHINGDRQHVRVPPAVWTGVRTEGMPEGLRLLSGAIKCSTMWSQLHGSMNILKVIKMCTLKGSNVWYVNYTSIKLLPKNIIEWQDWSVNTS